ncbi:MAG: phosphoribosylaminoimidazolesuccinocarboxamide synthase [Patescibacteria group bacterium]
MAKIPENLREDALSKYLQEHGLKRIGQGKVRDTYYLDNERLLVVTTDRISIFEFVLGVLVPKKGEVLTALTHFWLTKVLHQWKNHLINCEHPNLNYCPNTASLLKETLLPDLQIERSLIVRNLSGKMYPFEMIFRHHIGGSVFKQYQKTGMAGGLELPANLPKWSKLESPIFTPSTKEDVGHDINVNGDYFYSEMEKLGLKEEAEMVVWNLDSAYSIAYKYAEERGVLILDTKFEVSGLIIADEVLTPDSSRFGLADDCVRAIAENREPKSYDKQAVRDWGAKVITPFFDESNNCIVGINKLDPEIEDHVHFVHSLEIPTDIITGTTERYLNIFKILTGKSLEEYQKAEMGL